MATFLTHAVRLGLSDLPSTWNLNRSIVPRPLIIDYRAQRSSSSFASCLDPEVLHYTQESIKRSFRCGRSLQSTIQELQRNPRAAFQSIPIIQIFALDGKMWTADNRRLYCFRQAKLTEIPVRHIQAARVDPRKFTSTNGGISIRVR